MIQMIIPRMIYIPLCDLRKGTIELLINCNQMACSFFIVVLNLMNIENYIENYKFLKNNFKWKSFFPFFKKNNKKDNWKKYYNRNYFKVKW